MTYVQGTCTYICLNCGYEASSHCRNRSAMCAEYQVQDANSLHVALSGCLSQCSYQTDLSTQPHRRSVHPMRVGTCNCLVHESMSEAQLLCTPACVDALTHSAMRFCKQSLQRGIIARTCSNHVATAYTAKLESVHCRRTSHTLTQWVRLGRLCWGACLLPYGVHVRSNFIECDYIVRSYTILYSHFPTRGYNPHTITYLCADHMHTCGAMSLSAHPTAAMLPWVAGMPPFLA